MATMTLVNLVCYDCNVDEIYSIGKIEQPDMSVIMSLQTDSIKHTTHGGFVSTFRIAKLSDLDRFEKDFNADRVRRVLEYNVSKEKIKDEERRTVDGKVQT